MALDISQLTDYTWQQIKVAAKYGLAHQVAGFASLSIGGKTITRGSIKDFHETIRLCDEMIAIESGGENGGGNALVRFGEQR